MDTETPLIPIGPIEAFARTSLGPRSDYVPETVYLYAVREFVDMVVTRTAEFETYKAVKK